VGKRMPTPMPKRAWLKEGVKGHMNYSCLCRKKPELCVGLIQQRAMALAQVAPDDAASAHQSWEKFTRPPTSFFPAIRNCIHAMSPFRRQKPREERVYEVRRAGVIPGR